MKNENAEKVCERCGGTGEIIVPVWDGDSQTYHPTGVRECGDCQLAKEEQEYE